MSMEIDANTVISNLSKMLAEQAVEIATLRAAVDQLQRQSSNQDIKKIEGV